MSPLDFFIDKGNIGCPRGPTLLKTPQVPEFRLPSLKVERMKQHEYQNNKHNVTVRSIFSP